MSKFIKILLIVLLFIYIIDSLESPSSVRVENLQSTNISSKAASICSGTRTIDISDVSEDGSVIVGECRKKEAPNDQQVFIYSPSGIESLESMGKQSLKHLHISADGSVIWGTFYVENEGSHIFHYTQLDGFQDLGTMRKKRISIGGVSADGSVIVGYFDNSSNDNSLAYRAFRYSQTLGFEDLGDMSAENTFARGVSADGSWLVGSTDIGSSSKSTLRWISTHAFRYSRADGMKDLGIMGDAAFATGISNDGLVIVGSGSIYHTIFFIAEISRESFVFVYTDKGGMQKLEGIGGERGGVIKISADGTRLVGSYRDKNRESYAYTANLVLQ